jgi:hypothetical protein
MKIRPFLLLSLLIAAAPAWGNWMKVDEDDDRAIYIDLAEVKKTENLRIVWKLQDLKKKGPLGEKSTRSRWEFDCAIQSGRPLENFLYSGAMASGKVLASKGAGDWRSVESRSVGEIIFRFVCAP